LASLEADGRKEILGGDWESNALEASSQLIWCEKLTEQVDEGNLLTVCELEMRRFQLVHSFRPEASATEGFKNPDEIPPSTQPATNHVDGP
jgi:hypothetical protein